MSEIIDMALTCSKCGATVHNDMPDIRHPLDFLEALRRRGWKIPASGGVHALNQKCAKCASS